MAKRSLTVGGTLGALAPSEELARSLSIQFKFDSAVVERMLELCPATEEWLARQRDLTFDEKYGPELAFEMCALRFLRRKVERVSRADQVQYLRNMDVHLDALIRLFLYYPEFSHTAADPISYLLELGRGETKPDRERHQVLDDVVKPLFSLRAFALMQQRALGSEPKTSPEAIRRRNDFPRFVLIADIIATYKRMTGLEPTAYAPDGGRPGPAVELVTTLVPPIMKAAKLTKIEITAQTAKNEIATIKRLWADGQHPEFAPGMPSWGK